MEKTINNQDLFEEELKLEDYFTTIAQESLRTSIEKNTAQGTAAVTATGQNLIKYGLDDALKAVSAWVETVKKPKRGVKPSYMYILEEIEKIYTTTSKGNPGESYIKPEMLHTLTLAPFFFLVNNIERCNRPLAEFVPVVAKEIEEECKIEAFMKTIPEHTQKGVLNGIKDRHNQHYKIYYAKQAMEKNDFQWAKWPKKDLYHLTLELLEVVIVGSGYWYIEPPQTLKDMPTVRPTEWLIKTWKTNNDRIIGNAFKNCPTVIPPKPWTSVKSGGYHGRLAGRHWLVRIEGMGRGAGVFMQQYMQRLDETDLTDIMNAINIIQEVPWRINKEVFEVFSHIIEAGGGLAGVPTLEPLPQLPDLPEGYTEEDLKEHKKKKWSIYKQDITRETIACRCMNHYRIAKKYSKYDRIYFPYNMDFRGRVYPIPSFSPQSDDVNKGLLEFADAPACQSDDDIKWLMIHGANVAGVDKVSFEERIKWVLENEQNILESAKDPLNYRWWMNDDFEHFQMLAFCFEWKRWKEYQQEHKTAKGFVCNIPIAFDGTCSGLQHYSALLRDEKGGLGF